MSKRGKHGQQPNKVDYEDLVNDLQFGTWTITLLELAYREYIRRRTDIPEGARNLLVSHSGDGLVQFAKRIGKIIGNIEMAYLRGRQEGHEVKNPKDWDGGFNKRAKEN